MHGLILTGFNSHSSAPPSSKRTAGAHRIATYLRAREWDIEVLEFVMAWNLDQLKEFAKSRITNKTVFVGFGGTFPIWSDTLDEFFIWIKVAYPNVAIIAGGQVSNLYKIQADWYIDGFGERALEALLKHIVGNGQVKWQFGVNSRKVIKGNIDYPSYPMSDLSIKYEDRDFILETETLTTELGRGCIFNCSFCNFPILGVKTDHSRDATNLYNELLENYNRFGVTKYIIADETVNDYSEKLEKFAKVIKELPFRPRMHGFARADLLVSRKHDWDTMIEMGFVGHHYGIESTNLQTLKVIGKGMRPEILLPGLIEARNYFKKYSDYKSDISLIAGLPHETRQSLETTLEWVSTNWKSEAIALFPLYIPKVEMDNKSKLSFDYIKHGYRETAYDYMPEVREQYARIPTQYGMGEGLLQSTGMSWENDEWNLLDVMKIVVDFYKKYPSVSGISMWKLGEYENLLKLPYSSFVNKTLNQLTIEDKLFHQKNIEFLNNYIENKLSWVPNSK
jgi:radical SAM superfamily enzyme YgiQ (UPF0313 family)